MKLVMFKHNLHTKCFVKVNREEGVPLFKKKKSGCLLCNYELNYQPRHKVSVHVYLKVEDLEV